MINTDALNRAVAGLRFVDVFINLSSSNLAEGFDPKFDARSESLGFQTKNIVTGSEIIEVQGDGRVFFIFRVRSELGIRIAEKEQFSDRVDDPDVLAQVEGVMYADYEVSDVGITEDQEALDAFALNNVSYHVWPYWREYVTSQLVRMNMPKIVLPMFLRPSNQS